MSSIEESKAERRSRLHHDYLGVAGRVKRLVNTSPQHTTLDQDELARWQTLYAEAEAAVVLRRYDEITTPGSAQPSSETLEEWLAYARKLLEFAPDNPR